MTNEELQDWWESDEKLTHSEASLFVGLHPAYFSSEISQGRIQVPRYKLGRKWLYNKDDLINLIRERSEVLNASV